MSRLHRSLRPVKSWEFVVPIYSPLHPTTYTNLLTLENEVLSQKNIGVVKYV